ncbi:Bifunctional adenosylcobalamin biosynthesis protein CobP [Azospirillaceae bacterium]
MTIKRLTLILGGARSGKSAFAERLVEAASTTPLYIATAHAGDDEMTARIERHQKRRGPTWRTIEAPLNLPETITSYAKSNCVVLVDCLTLWVSNLMMAERNIADETSHLSSALQTCEGAVVLVSNEVGLGIVPNNNLARAFRDHVGNLHQEIARIADSAYLVTAGLPLALK